MSVSLSTPVSPVTTTIAAPYWTPSSVVESVKEGLREVDAVFTRIITSFPPGASAEKSELELCFEPTLPEFYKVLDKAGTAVQDPNMLLATDKLFGGFFQQCFEDETYRKQRQEHDNSIRHHEQQVRILEKNLDECQKQNPDRRCYKLVEVGRLPKLERVRTEEQTPFKSREWVPVQGYLCWSVNVDVPWWRGLFDKLYNKGGYNCDLTTNKPTV